MQTGKRRPAGRRFLFLQAAGFSIQPRMKQQFAAEQWFPFPRTLVFAFFANPGNLPPLMPGWQKARIDEATFCPPPPRPDDTPDYGTRAAGAGTRLTISARAVPFLPLRAPWLALIEDFRWNEGFCDVQLSGPFAYWRHCHSVRDGANPKTGAQGTIVRDHVTYMLPLDPLSRLGLPIARGAMLALFKYRQGRAKTLMQQFAAQVSS